MHQKHYEPKKFKKKTRRWKNHVHWNVLHIFQVSIHPSYTRCATQQFIDKSSDVWSLIFILVTITSFDWKKKIKRRSSNNNWKKWGEKIDRHAFVRDRIINISSSTLFVCMYVCMCDVCSIFTHIYVETKKDDHQQTAL